MGNDAGDGRMGGWTGGCSLANGAKPPQEYLKKCGKNLTNGGMGVRILFAMRIGPLAFESKGREGLF
jgi:hypothetical protein